MAAFESFHEDGSPLRMEELPARRVLAGLEPEPLLVRAVHRTTGEERWRIVKATAVPVREGEPRLAVTVIEDVTEVKRAELAERFLAQVGALLASDLDYEQTLAKVADLAVPRLADWCAVTLPAGDRLRPVAVAHSDPEKVAFARDYQERYPSDIDAPTGSAQVLRDGVSQLVNRIDDAMLEAVVADPEQRELVRTIGLHAAMVVPMVAAGRVIGVITLRRRRVRAHLQPVRPRAGRGARPAGRHRGRERPPVRGTLAHRRHAPARAAARRAAGHRGPAAGLALPPGG